MKNSAIIFTILVGILCFNAQTVLAIKKIAFPDHTALQPMPDGSAPNLSGNIDWPNSLPDQNPSSTDPFSSFPDQSTITNDPADASAGTNNTNNTSNSTVNNNTPNSGASSVNTPTGSPYSVNPTGNGTSNANDSSNQATQQPSNSLDNSSAYDFSTNPSQGNSQTQQGQNTSIEGLGTTNETAGSQTDTQTQTRQQRGITQSTFAWALAFGSMILLVVAFVLWKLKKTPDDVNQ